MIEVKDECAFPMVYNTNDYGGANSVIRTGGITKRQYFAAHALMGILGSGEILPTNEKKAAKLAVQLADALLEELSK